MPSGSKKKVVVFAVVLVALFLASLCISAEYYYRFYSPADILSCIAAAPGLAFTYLFDYGNFAQARYGVIEQLPMFDDFVARLIESVKYVIAGIMLAVSGMLYQNTFRNPIAAPSMLGVSNGINLALVILAMQFGYQSLSMIGHYYVYSFIGGALILALVLAGGKWVSAKGEFNVVNMLLIGTIVSQLLGVIITYGQNLMSEQAWEAYYYLQSAVKLTSSWTFITLFGGAIIALVPVILFRFKLNLVSFSDDEVKLLGVNPNKLRFLALGCGSLMILVAQVNVGQVAMASLVLPFVSRAVFGSEFRKQLVGNVLLGAILLLVCGDLVNWLVIENVPVDLGTIVTVVAMPLFVWMLAIRQRNWE